MKFFSSSTGCQETLENKLRFFGKLRHENKLEVSCRNANDLFKRIFRAKRKKKTTKPSFDEDVLGKFLRRRKSLVGVGKFLFPNDVNDMLLPNCCYWREGNLFENVKIISFLLKKFMPKKNKGINDLSGSW